MSIIHGTDANEKLKGTNDSDIIFGEGGNDLIVSLKGHDFVDGGQGNDTVLGGLGDDVIFAKAGNDSIFGEAGNDWMSGGKGYDFLNGGQGNDTILGDLGNDILVGKDGIDTLTGGQGYDDYVFSGNVFSGGTPAPAAGTHIDVLNQPDIITDFQVRQDQLVLDASDLGIDSLVFQKGISSEIVGNSNAIVLLDPFANAAAAAQAIADNNKITADEGVFVYFNSTLGIARSVYSQDLSSGGDISVLANLNNLAGDAGLASLANFSASNFGLV